MDPSGGTVIALGPLLAKPYVLRLFVGSGTGRTGVGGGGGTLEPSVKILLEDTRVGGAFREPLGTAIPEKVNSGDVACYGYWQPGQLQAMVKEYQPVTAVIEKLAIAAGRCDDSSCTTSAV
ncbi:hypothetical protein MMC29_005402 [Sticta canariensis]|nr:hypothetical protein [Sticta canariensis]